MHTAVWYLAYDFNMGQKTKCKHCIQEGLTVQDSDLQRACYLSGNSPEYGNFRRGNRKL
jgi:hypothetical protein